MLKIKTIPLGCYQTNCYIVTDTASGESAVVDPGVYDRRLEWALEAEEITEIRYILLTHGHFDHICGACELKKNFGGMVLIHSEDANCLEDSEWSLADSVNEYSQTPMSADKTLEEGSRFMLGETEFTVMHTPGHTKGGVCYIADGNMFSGDTLFKVGVGRTDLPGGHLRTLCNSLKRIGAIEENLKIFPGHGDSTNLENEKAANILLRSK